MRFDVTKYTLGIHNGLESGVCLMKDGKLLEAVSEERFNFIKVYAGLPQLSLNYILNKYKLHFKDIDAVIYSRVTFKINWFNYSIKILKKILISIFSNPFLIKKYVVRIRKELKDKIYKKEFYDWMDKLGINRNKIILLEHHKAHAWSAFSCSPFENALVVTADGRGDFKSTTISEGSKKYGLKELDFLTSFDSLGFLYGQITKYLGFTPHRHEGKVTGLAAFGNPKKTIHIFNKMVSWNSFLGHWNTNLNLYSPHNINDLETFKKIFKPFKKEDIAAGVQKHCEELLVKYIEYWIKKLKKNSINVCLAGGVFANVKINQKISEIQGVKNIFVFPNMGDGGLTVGGVCYQNFISQDKTNIEFSNVYLGKDYNDDDILKLLEANKHSLKYHKMKNRPVEISLELEKNKIVGYYDGRMEFGPRALGARSILVSAEDKSTNDYLNKRLERTEFMPFAPVTPIDYAAESYIGWKENDIASYYMTRTYHCFQSFINDHKAVVHIDGTARPQIISPDFNKRYYDLVKTYCDRNKKKALINTSFNVHEQPIIISPDLAIKNLLENRIDTLILSDYLVKKIK